MRFYHQYFLICLTLLFSCVASAQSHPKLVLSSESAAAIQRLWEDLPLMRISLQQSKAEVDADIELGVLVPVPKDMAGGYTHERHKKNFLILQKAGALYQITGEEKYAKHVREVLLEYAASYPSWPLHPADRSYAPGRIFWQCLNDANWLVYMSQAYDCIYDYLEDSERKVLEYDLFRPAADHISIKSPQFYSRIHNHSTWANAGVGMMGLVMNDQELIKRSLYGIDSDSLGKDLTDDDGGLIKLPGQTTTGFFAQLDYLFSPDGFYTEGPYYQRYAMYPFLLYAQAIENFFPELKIFEYRDSVLSKAVYSILNLTDKNGEFFPLNDAQKGMSYMSRELVSSVDIIYHFCGKDPQLLSIAKKQGQVLLDGTGLSVAGGLKLGREEEFKKFSMELRDGRKGDEGGIGIIRSGRPGNELCLVMKYTGQGLSHGHYDKLSFMLFDRGEEVMQDYGMARFVNIDQKYGGGYLPENTTWAKQSIAHNTLVINQQSHFKGDYKTGVKYHSEGYFFSSERDDIQIVSAKESNAYPGIDMHRTMAVLQGHAFENPIVVDVFRVSSENVSQYDLPFLYKGQVMSANFSYTSPDKLSALGDSDGYQHLWLEGQGQASDPNTKLSWLSNSRFYTLTTLSSEGDQLLFARTGANDPDFNLRRDPLFIIRRPETSKTVFVSILESHGHYSPVSEIATNASSRVKSLVLELNDEEYTALSFFDKNDSKWLLIIANKDSDPGSRHSVEILDSKITWKGPYHITNN